MRRLSLKQIETLQAIDNAGSLVQAAAALNMTPAALTARVKGLEASVGLRLFDRTPAGMRLTKAGEAALGASRVVEQAMRNFADTLAAIRTGEGGLLSVGAVSTAKYFAPKLIAAFVAARPKLDLRFLIGNRDATIESLRASEVEIALCGRPPRDMAVESAPLGPHPYVLVAPADHRLAGMEGLTRADLAGETFLIREPGSGTRSLFEAFIGETGGRPVKLGMELGSNESIKQAVIAGLGIALLSAHTIGAEIESGRLVRTRRRWSAYCSPVVCNLPDGPFTLADCARVPGFRRAGRRKLSSPAGKRRRNGCQQRCPPRAGSNLLDGLFGALGD